MTVELVQNDTGWVVVHKGKEIPVPLHTGLLGLFAHVLDQVYLSYNMIGLKHNIPRSVIQSCIDWVTKRSVTVPEKWSIQTNLMGDLRLVAHRDGMQSTYPVPKGYEEYAKDWVEQNQILVDSGLPCFSTEMLVETLTAVRNRYPYHYDFKRN